MRYTLTPLTPLDLADVPVTLAEAKAWLNVSHAEDDDLITALLLGVVEAMEEATGLSFAGRSYVYEATAHRGVHARHVDLPRSPVASVDAVSVFSVDGGETPLALGTDYASGVTGRVAFPRGYALPAGYTIQIQFTAGPAPLAHPLAVAARRALALHYTWRSDAVVGTTAVKLPAQALQMLGPYRRVTV